MQQELDLPVPASVMTCWTENTRVVRDYLTAAEHDDFFSAMLLGVQPQRTCLSYRAGAYRECLLSSFDSNKKVANVTANGRIVGRAFLRLTKGRMTEGKENARKERSGFTFVDVEHPDETSAATPSGERLTLFLERPYIAGVNDETKSAVKELLMELARHKAEALGALLVLSPDYRGASAEGFAYTEFCLYISRSKAGKQYLDSLGGQATVSREGRYENGFFLVKEA